MPTTPPNIAPTSTYVGATLAYRQWIAGACSILEHRPFWLDRGVSIADTDIIVSNFMTIITDILEGKEMFSIGEIRATLSPDGLGDGWIQMDGGQVLRATYPTLSALFPQWWEGAFIRFPNMNQRTLVGRGGLTGAYGSTPTYAVGAVDGSPREQITIAQMPSHTHTPLAGSNFLSTVPAPTGGATLAPGTTLTSRLTTGATGGNAWHNNMPPFLSVTYYIYGGE